MFRVLFFISALLFPAAASALSSASIPTKIPVYWAQTASNSFSTCPMPTPSQIPITAGRASWTDGFPPLTFLSAASGGVPPFGQDFNGALCQISQWSRWYNAGASIPYDSTFQSTIGGYPRGAIVPSAANFGTFWFSTVENNTSNPDTGGAGWILLAPVYQNTTVTGASTTYLTSQMGQNVVRSNAGAVMVDTLPGTGTGVLPQGNQITVTNGDASAFLVIKAGTGSAIKTSVAGAGYVILGPGQSAKFNSDGTNYWGEAPTRGRLGANTTLFVSSGAGSNNNHGFLIGSPFADMTFAYAFAQQNLDLNGFVLTISVADGTYGATTFNGALVGATLPSSVLVIGDTTTPDNVNVTSSASPGTVVIQNSALLILEGMKISNSASNGLFVSQNAWVQYQLIDFGAAGNTFNQVASQNGAYVSMIGPYTISTGAGCHWLTSNGGTIDTKAAATVTIANTPTYGSAFVCAQYPSFIVINGSFHPSYNILISVTGSRYSAFLNGVINTGGLGANFFPGNSPGTTGTGGQYQ